MSGRYVRSRRSDGSHPQGPDQSELPPVEVDEVDGADGAEAGAFVDAFFGSFVFVEEVDESDDDVEAALSALRLSVR